MALKTSEFRSALESRKSLHENLRTTVFGLISTAIADSGVSAMPILSRVKDTESACRKLDSKSYSSPLDEMTDLVGFRIVLYLEHEIEKLEEVLRSFFEISEKNSINRRVPRDIKEVGYRSLHLICRLGNKRKPLPEYKRFSDIWFEIQIRTALEHAWAEIEHKQNYKSGIALPRDLQRRFNVLSGTLELIDRELSSIVIDANDYKRRLSEGDTRLRDDRLSVTSIQTVCEKFAAKENLTFPEHQEMINLSPAFEELGKFGIKTVSELDSLLASIPIEEYKEIEQDPTFLGIIRDAMIISDHEKFFKNSYRGQFGFEESDVKMYSKFFNTKKLRDLITENGGKIFPEDN